MAFKSPNTVGTTVEVGEIESLALGALIVGDGSGAPSTLTVGSNGALLQALSSESAGVIWRTSPQMVDSIDWSAGVAATAGNYQILRNDDTINRLQINAPQTSMIELSINGQAQVLISEEQVNFQNNLITMDGVLTVGPSIIFSSNTAVSAGSYQIARDADSTNQLHFNVPTGASFEWSVNDSAELSLSATNLQPGGDDGLVLGASGVAFADLFLASGAVINFNASDVTITHGTNTLTFAGASTGYTFDAELTISTSGGTAQDVIDISYANTAYTSNKGLINIIRTGSLTGVGNEKIIDLKIDPNYILTEPGGGTAQYYGISVDLGGLQVTAGVGSSEVAALQLSGSADGDIGNSYAILVDQGTSAFNGNLVPKTDNAGALGTSTLGWADLFLANGGVLNFNNGDITLTHGTNVLTFAGGDLAMGNDALIRRDVNAGITASTNQAQGNGALTAEVNEVSTCANVNDTVTLPAAVAGLRVVIINNGAQTMRIYPAAGDNLGAGIDLATTLAAGSNVVYQAYDATNWESI